MQTSIITALFSTMSSIPEMKQVFIYLDLALDYTENNLNLISGKLDIFLKLFFCKKLTNKLVNNKTGCLHWRKNRISSSQRRQFKKYLKYKWINNFKFCDVIKTFCWCYSLCYARWYLWLNWWHINCIEFYFSGLSLDEFRQNINTDKMMTLMSQIPEVLQTTMYTILTQPVKVSFTFFSIFFIFILIKKT